MIKLENTYVDGWEATVRGMRNPMNSWDKSDSGFGCGNDKEYFCENCSSSFHCTSRTTTYNIGSNDLKLMRTLCKAGSDHRKFMRMINVSVDITAPLYWWKEFDTYKVGTVANSCSTMHKIHAKEFTLDDFSHEHLITGEKPLVEGGADAPEPPNAIWLIHRTIQTLNQYRDLYLQTKDKKYWWQMIQLLPSSYNQKRTVQFNYEVLYNIYNARCTHKLDEWKDFCNWIEELPYFNEITQIKGD